MDTNTTTIGVWSLFIHTVRETRTSRHDAYSWRLCEVATEDEAIAAARAIATKEQPAYYLFVDVVVHRYPAARSVSDIMKDMGE